MYSYNYSHLSSSALTGAVALYSSEQIYDIEQAWFAKGYSSFALMQQAAWQMSQHIIQTYTAQSVRVSRRHGYQQSYQKK